MNYLFLLLITFSFSLQESPREITVTLRTSSEQPIIAEVVQFFDEKKNELSKCTTDTQGACTMTFQSSDSIIRGSLTTSYGRRPLTFKTNVAVILTLNDSDELITPHDIYVTRTPANISRETKEPDFNTPTATPTFDTPTNTPTFNTPTTTPTFDTPRTTPTAEAEAEAEAESFNSTLILNIRLAFLAIGILIITIAIVYLNIKIKKQ